MNIPPLQMFQYEGSIKCPLLRIQTGQKGGGCAMVWMVVWLERIASKLGG